MASFNYFLLEFNQDFALYDSHNICFFASKTNAFITVNKKSHKLRSVLALFVVYPNQFVGWHPALRKKKKKTSKKKSKEENQQKLGHILLEM